MTIWWFTTISAGIQILEILFFAQPFEIFFICLCQFFSILCRPLDSTQFHIVLLLIRRVIQKDKHCVMSQKIKSVR